MKSNVLLSIAGVEALLRTAGSLPVNVKFLIEGEEEIGSPGLPAFLAAERERVACDLIVSADGLQGAAGQPQLWVGLRGLAGVRVDVQGAGSDLHSGMFGGIAPNAAQAMAELLASLHGPDGRILVEGFYDDVLPLTDAERAALAASADNERNIARQLGVATLVGEAGYPAAERLAARPTLEINGMWGGFLGDGAKTVIPAEAHANITCRLVPNQDPRAIQEYIARHLATHAPPAVTVHVTKPAGGAKPYRMSLDHPANQVLRDVLTAAYHKAPAPIWSGATVPLIPLCLDILGVDTVTLGFGLPDEPIHAPNEFCRATRIDEGAPVYAQLLEALSKHSPSELRRRK
jgi:acetylornithine deacetylase/succinyl-diaminopimelate desuccinylase-like protein